MIAALSTKRPHTLLFRVWFAAYEPDAYRDIAVSIIEAQQARMLDHVFTADASIEERAKYLAKEKFKALNKVQFGHPLPTVADVRAQLAAARLQRDARND